MKAGGISMVRTASSRCTVTFTVSPGPLPTCSRIAFSMGSMCSGRPYFTMVPVYGTPSKVTFTGTCPRVPNSFSTS